MGKINFFLKKNGLVKNIGILAGGTAMAQIITFVATIYLTRVYLPEDFGLLSLLTSIVSLLAPVSSMRYNKAIILSKDKKELKSLFYLSGSINISLFIFLCLIIGVIWFFREFFGIAEFKNLLWILPFAVLLFGFTNIFQSYNEKLGKFKFTSSVALIEATSKSLLQYVLYDVLSKIGLLLGYLGALVINFLMYLRSYFKERVTKEIRIKKSDLRFVAKKHDNFPKYFVWSNIIDSASQNLCALTFPFFFTLEVLGNFSIAYKVVRLPAMLIGMATRRVYYPRASELFYTDKRAFFKLYRKSTKALILIAILPVILLELFIPIIFEVFFDNNWSASVPYAQIILIYVFFNFINSLAHENMLIFGLQKSFLIAEILWVLLSLTLIFLAYVYGNALLAVIFYALSGVTMEILVFSMQYRKGEKF